MANEYQAQMLSNESDGAPSPILDDVTAEDQYAAHVGSAADSPERRLLAAILSDALSCMRAARRSRETAEALEWILESAPERFCSFENICESLELDPQYIRRKVLEGVSWTSSLSIPVSVRRKRQSIPVQVAA